MNIILKFPDGREVRFKARGDPRLPDKWACATVLRVMMEIELAEKKEVTDA